MSLSIVEIDPAFPLQGAGLDIVEIGPGYEVNGLGAYDNVSLVGGCVGAGCIGAYDNVSLVGALGQVEKPWYKRPLILGAIGLGVVAAGTGAYMLYR